MSSDATAIRSVSRALALLSLFSVSRTELSLRDLVELSGLPRTTVLRLVSALQEDGLVWSVGKQTYAVGPGLLRWANLATTAFHIPREARSALAGLVSEVGETASLYVRDGNKRTCVAFEEGDHVLRHVAKLGSQGALWQGASGRVLLAGAGEELLESVLSTVPEGQDPGIEQLRAWSENVGAHGFAMTHNERGDGLSVAAVPLLNSNGTAFASLSVAGPSARFESSRHEEFRRALDRAKRIIESSQFARFGTYIS